VSLVALGAVLVVVAMLGVNRLIRSGLAAPRVVETGVPAGLPWIEVGVPGPRGKRLFGWFIPAATAQGGPAPALAILHGWGGNAEVMLPLARPLHEAGYALLFFDARSHGRSDGDSFASLPRFPRTWSTPCGGSRPGRRWTRSGWAWWGIRWAPVRRCWWPPAAPAWRPWSAWRRLPIRRK